MNIHIDQNPGVHTRRPRRWSKRTNVTGETYWHVEEESGNCFGDRPVSGTIEAFGRTQAEAKERLLEKRKKLMEAFWE